MANTQQKKMFEKGHFRVTIFGSARIKRGDVIYKQIYELAKLIGSKNMDVVTGGGPGLMEAANRGHKQGSKENQAHSLGLPIKLTKKENANKSLDIIKEFERFSKRLDHFMALSHVVVVAPGGIGTTLELFYTWQLIQVKQLCEIPVILCGSVWKPLLKWIKKGPLQKGFLSKNDLDYIYLTKNNKQVMQIIEQTHQMYNTGQKNICQNIVKYRIKT